jgi:hypothetical protein
MRKLALAVPILLALAACGADKSCSTTAGNVSQVTNGCQSLSAGTAVSIAVRLCPSCSETSPRCTGGEVFENTHEIHLNPVVSVCTEDQGCAIQACQVNAVSCALDQPLSPGSYRVLYPAANASGADVATINVVSGGTATCLL